MQFAMLSEENPRDTKIRNGSLKSPIQEHSGERQMQLRANIIIDCIEGTKTTRDIVQLN